MYLAVAWENNSIPFGFGLTADSDGLLSLMFSHQMEGLAYRTFSDIHTTGGGTHRSREKEIKCTRYHSGCKHCFAQW